MEKGFPTFNTHIRPFSSMKSLVGTEGITTSKGFPTLITLIRLFSSVNGLM